MDELQQAMLGQAKERQAVGAVVPIEAPAQPQRIVIAGIQVGFGQVFVFVLQAVIALLIIAAIIGLLIAIPLAWMHQ